MDQATIATFGERVTINGFCVMANVLENSFETSGLPLPIDGEQVTLVIEASERQRIRLAKGVPVEYRGKKAQVSDFNITNTTLLRVELQ